MENVTTVPFLKTTISTIHEAIIPQFKWYDYAFVTIMLAVSGSLGIFFGCCGKKQSTAKEYLLGGKQLKVIPVALSLMAR